MSDRVRIRWRVHWGLVATMLALGLAAAFALGTDHAHGMFSTRFFVAAVALFWTAHATITSLLVWKWGRSALRVVGIHAVVVVGFPTIFGVVASIVS